MNINVYTQYQINIILKHQVFEPAGKHHERMQEKLAILKLLQRISLAKNCINIQSTLALKHNLKGKQIKHQKHNLKK